MAGLSIVQLTPGAGGMFCGGCMRDNALAAALRKQGHDVLLLPLYMPLTLDEVDNSFNRVFFGGVNVFLQQKSTAFRKIPGWNWIEKRLDDPGLLRFASSFGIKTNPEELGEMTVSMLKGEDGNQSKEVEKLSEWMKGNTRPDVVVLSNALLLGAAKGLREALKAPIVCTLQGEDYFVDHLPDPHREIAWKLLRETAADVAAFIPVSKYYGDVMQRRMELSPSVVHPVHNGIDLTGYGPPAEKPKGAVIGYLARMAPEKGLALLVDAFARIVKRGKVAAPILRIAGSLTAMDKPFVETVKKQIAADGLTDRIEFFPNVDRAKKIEFLQGLSVFSVPACYGEAFGLYVLESLACGVPVVQPEHGAFPELLARTGGGILHAPDDAEHLAQRIEGLLLDEPRRAALGAEGRERVLRDYSIERAAKDIAEVYRGVAKGME